MQIKTYNSIHKHNHFNYFNIYLNINIILNKFKISYTGLAACLTKKEFLFINLSKLLVDTLVNGG